MKIRKKIMYTAMALFMLIGGSSALTSCDFLEDFTQSGGHDSSDGGGNIENDGNDTTNDGTVTGKFRREDYLKVDGTQVKSNYGRGNAVMLRGTNAGGYLVTEQWMTAVSSGKTEEIDYKSASDLLTQRFGEEKMLQAWELYRDHFWTEQDFKNCADMGMTVLRLPFTYMNVDFNGQYDFGQLDDFVEGAAEYGIYTILDLHGAYGSQNGELHSGQSIESAENVDFYRNEEKTSKTVALWEALTEHYADNPAVAAFDLLNEPAVKGGEGGKTDRTQWNFYDRIYDAVRAIDEDRIVIFESCWDAENLPHPAEYGWENCMYSYHSYFGSDNAATDEEAMSQQKPEYVRRLKEIADANYGVPNYMGEFSCYGYQCVWEYVLQLLNTNGWHWTNWSYKVNNYKSGWGIYNTYAQSAYPFVDRIYEMDEKWEKIETSAAWPTTFSSGKTLAEIIREACSA